MDTLELGKQRAKELGLSWDTHRDSYPIRPDNLVIRAEPIFKLLGEAPIGYGFTSSNDNGFSFSMVTEESTRSTKYDTHQALLIGIRPIVKKELNEKIADVLKDHSLSATKALEQIRTLLGES